MKIILNSFFIILIFATLVGCGDQTIRSYKKTSDIIIDGNGKDWSETPLEYNEDMKMVYGVVNDETTLSLMARFSDRQLLRMFQSRGVVLWFNEKNDTDKNIGIYFVDKNMPQIGLKKEGRQRSQANEGLQKPFQLTGSFFVVKEDTIPINDIEEIEAAADYIDGLFCFEFRIPMQNDEYNPYALSFPENSEIGAGIEIAAISKELREKMKAQLAEKKSGMRGGGRPGGGMSGSDKPGGRMKGGNRGNRTMPDFEKKEIRFTIKLNDINNY